MATHIDIDYETAWDRERSFYIGDGYTTTYMKNRRGIWTDDDKYLITLWKMSIKERLSALFFGYVWVSLTNRKYPHYVGVYKNGLRKAK